MEKAICTFYCRHDLLDKFSYGQPVSAGPAFAGPSSVSGSNLCQWVQPLSTGQNMPNIRNTQLCLKIQNISRYSKNKHVQIFKDPKIFQIHKTSISLAHLCFFPLSF